MQHQSHDVTCEECGQEATGGAEGWEALLVDLDEDGQPITDGGAAEMDAAIAAAQTESEEEAVPA